MKINNPLRFADLSTEKLSSVSLVFVILSYIFILINMFHINYYPLFYVQSIILLIYILFVPGILILRLLRIYNITEIENIAYSIGISISFLMFIGAAINYICPFFKIKNPISFICIMAVINSIIMILIGLNYYFNRRKEYFRNTIHINYKDLKIIALISLIPILMSLGSYFVNFYAINSIMILFLISIGIIGLLVVFDYIKPKFYLPTIFLISISLMLHNTLITNHIWGWDINVEYYFADLVLKHSIWEPNIEALYNSMLSITILAPLLSIISKISLNWIFKIIYPLLFSLVPLTLYEIFKKQFNPKIAFLSCFFLISFNVFYFEIMAIARQQIAEIFMVLLLLLLVDTKLSARKNAILFVIFSFSLIVSHYGAAYLYFFFIVLTFIVIKISENVNFKQLKFTKSTITNKSKKITIEYILLFITFAFLWYFYIAGSVSFNTFTNLSHNIIINISDFLNPNSSQGMAILLTERKNLLINQINRIINYLNQILILIGISYALYKEKVFELQKNYKYFSLICFLTLLLGIFLPLFASYMNMERIYQISLLTLAPFMIIGFLVVIKMILNSLKIKFSNKTIKKTYILIMIYLLIFLFYQTGLIFQTFEGKSDSISLNMNIDYPKFNQKELTSAKWLENSKYNHDEIFADDYRILLLNNFALGYVKPLNPYDLKREGYIYLGTLNSQKNEFMIINTVGVSRSHNYTSINNTSFNKKNLIYSNGGSKIYFS